jgi:hypothetical protein
MKASQRQGFAIPMVAGFCVILGILIAATAFIRTSTNRQQKADWQGIKAQFIAQGAIQVALYKFRILPNEGYDATEAALGGDSSALNTFLADVGTDKIPLGVDLAGNTYNALILEGRALNSVQDITAPEVWKHVIQLKALGEIQDAYRGTDGSQELRSEELTKTVEIQKIRQ